MADVHATEEPRYRELKWLRNNSEWLEREHAGEWVAIEGEEVLAIGPKLSEVMKATRTKGVQVPFVDAIRSNKYHGVQLFRRWI